MILTHKERVRRALAYESVDRLPAQISYTAAQGRRLAEHFGVTDQVYLATGLPARLDNQLVRVDLTFPPRYGDDGSVKFDWWGAGFDTHEEGYFIRISPLAETKDLDAYPWPDPQAPGLLDDALRSITADAGQHFIVPNFGFALFERAWSLRSFVHFFQDMVTDPAFVDDLLDRITAIQLVLIRRFIAAGVDGGYFGDDYGAQDNMLFSPKMWRRYIKPRLAQLFAPFREANLPVLMHSDGKIEAVLPDLVEIGLTAYNPVQPEVSDHAWLQRTFGTRLAYYGGVSTQTVLPFGSPDEVRAAVVACAQALAPEGTGLLIAPSHRMMSDIPMANVEALLEAFAALGAQP